MRVRQSPGESPGRYPPAEAGVSRRGFISRPRPSGRTNWQDVVFTFPLNSELQNPRRHSLASELGGVGNWVEIDWVAMGMQYTQMKIARSDRN